MDDFVIDDYINSNNLLKSLGWLFVLLILCIISYLNGSKLEKTPLMIFAVITWLIMIFLPMILNRDCTGSGSEYYCLGEITDNIDDYEESEQLGISLERSIINIITSVIYFGFTTRAIGKFHNVSGPFKGGAVTSAPKTGESFKQLSVSIAQIGPFSTMVYMAIVIIIINVISNLYIYFNCQERDDEDKKYVLRALIMAQYNVVIMTIVGIGVLIVSSPIATPPRSN
jgi:hypothetical protein